MMDASLRDWAGLQIYIVDMLVIKLDQFSDFVRFCGVFPQWRNAALEANVIHKASLDVLKASRKKLPMLIFKTDKNNNERSVYNVTNMTTFDVKLPFSYKYRFVGSSLGWLICIGKSMAVLVNPINNGFISLPVLKDPCQLWRKRYFENHIRKGILLSDPDASPNSFVIVVIYGDLERLAFLKSGEQSWNIINSEGFYGSDIIHYKGKLYGVDSFGQLVEIDLSSKTIRTIVAGVGNCIDVAYLVESQDGELLMVKREWTESDDDDDDDDHGEDRHVEARAAEYSGNEDNDNNHIIYHDSESESYDSEGEYNPALKKCSGDGFTRSFEFKVFKMTHPIEEGSATWVEIKNIGQQALFLGDNQSVSVSTTDFPGCKPNSIYYIAEHHNRIPGYVYRGINEDSGIFTLENERFYWFHILDCSEKYVQPSIWFVPNPQEINFG